MDAREQPPVPVPPASPPDERSSAPALRQLGFKELQAVFSLFEFLLFFFDYFLWRFVGETGFREQISRALQHRPRFLYVLLQSHSVLALISFDGETDFDRANHGRRAVAT